MPSSIYANSIKGVSGSAKTALRREEFAFDRLPWTRYDLNSVPSAECIICIILQSYFGEDRLAVLPPWCELSLIFQFLYLPHNTFDTKTQTIH